MTDSKFTKVEEVTDEGFYVSVDVDFLNDLGDNFIVWLKSQGVQVEPEQSIPAMGHLVAVIARNIDFANDRDDGKALVAISEIAKHIYDQLVEPAKQ